MLADGLPTNLSSAPNTNTNIFPFWTAGTIELMELSERPYGIWDDARPKPIVLSGGKMREKQQKMYASTLMEEKAIALEQQQPAFTCNDPNEQSCFVCHGIEDELKVISLTMVDE